MLRKILNMSWRQHHTRHQLYGNLPPITKTIQVRRSRHAGHCWRSRDELISDVLLWTRTYGWAKAGRPARTYIQQLCENTECSLEDLPEAMNDRERGPGIFVLAARHDYICIYIYIYRYIYIYMALNNKQWLKCHKNLIKQATKQPINIFIGKYIFSHIG